MKPLILTARERQVITLHLPDKQTAAALGITTRCVRFHWANIVKKLGGPTRLDAVYRHGMARARTS